MVDRAVAQKAPYIVDVESGKSYAWCSCGRSNAQPFCDGSHKGTGFAPTIHKAEKDGKVAFCGCKHAKTPPFCDGSHNSL